MSDVFIVTRWSTCADHQDFGPRAFCSFDGARDFVKEMAGANRDWWFEKSPGCAIRWRNPKDHAAGFWEIQRLGVTPP